MLVSNYHYQKRIMGIPLGILGFDRALYFYVPFLLGEYLYRFKEVYLKKPMSIIILCGLLFVCLVIISLYDIGIFSYCCQKLYPLVLIYLIFLIVSRYSEDNNYIGGQII